MLQAIEVIVEPSGAIRPLEELHVATPTRAVLILLPLPESRPEPEPGSAEGILQFLRDNPLPPECRRSAAEIDAGIQAERDAWD
jgi:hypothetical protein